MNYVFTFIRFDPATFSYFDDLEAKSLSFDCFCLVKINVDKKCHMFNSKMSLSKYYNVSRTFRSDTAFGVASLRSEEETLSRAPDFVFTARLLLFKGYESNNKLCYAFLNIVKTELIDNTYLHSLW